MSEQDLFAIETAAEVQETAAHFDALHHTEEELPGSFAAKAAIGDGPSGSGGSGSRSAGGGASGADEAAAMQPPPTRPPAKAEGPVPPGSPLNPGVGPVRSSSTCTQLLLCTVLLTSRRAECDKACFCLHCNPHQTLLVCCPASQDARQSQTKSQVPGEPVKLDSKVRLLGTDGNCRVGSFGCTKLGACRIRCQVTA